jgi:hypothetical protein
MSLRASSVRSVADHIAFQRSRNGIRRCNRYGLPPPWEECNDFP